MNATTSVRRTIAKPIVAPPPSVTVTVVLKKKAPQTIQPVGTERFGQEWVFKFPMPVGVTRENWQEVVKFPANIKPQRVTFARQCGTIAKGQAGFWMLVRV